MYENGIQVWKPPCLILLINNKIIISSRLCFENIKVFSSTYTYTLPSKKPQ